jgi:hypothetical protein
MGSQNNKIKQFYFTLNLFKKSSISKIIVPLAARDVVVS